MQTQAPTTRAALPLILIAAVIQGGALYGLHRAIQTHHWPATHLPWLLGLYSMTVLVPTTLQLLVEHARRALLWWLIAILAGALFGFGWHYGEAVAGRSLEDFNALGDYFYLIGVSCVLWLLSLPFAQSRLQIGRWSTAYRPLFESAWRNAIALVEAGVFTGSFWLLLLLWQTLFRMLGIDFFAQLFVQPAFIYPVTSVVFGCALHLIGSIDRLVAVVLEQVLNVLKWLGTVAGLLLALFTLALLVKLPGLVFEGQRAIGAVWLLWLVAVIVLLLNAAYRDGTDERPYPKWVAQSLRFVVPLTIVIAATALYALSVRTQRYGLSVERVWAFVVAIAAFIYSLGYSIAAFRRGPWLAGIARVNVTVALLLIVTMTAASTPLLSPHRLAANSQFRRALAAGDNLSKAGDLTPFVYLRFEAGQYGLERLRELAALQGQPNAERRARAAQALKQTQRWDNRAPPDISALVARMPVYPAGHTLDPDLTAILAGEWGRSDRGRYGNGENGQMAGIFADLDGDGAEEFIWLNPSLGSIYRHHDGHWQFIGGAFPEGTPAPWESLAAELAKGALSTQPRRWHDLYLGDHKFRVDIQAGVLGETH